MLKHEHLTLHISPQSTPCHFLIQNLSKEKVKRTTYKIFRFWHNQRAASGVWSSGVWSRVADRVLVLRPGVRPKPLRWERRVQDTGPPETSQPHIISVGKSSPRHLHLNAKTQLHPTARKLQCWKPHAKQLARQKHNHTH